MTSILGQNGSFNEPQLDLSLAQLSPSLFVIKSYYRGYLFASAIATSNDEAKAHLFSSFFSSLSNGKMDIGQASPSQI
jgi:hypothetical protein